MVGALAGGGVVALAAVRFVQRLNLIELYFLLGPVLCAQLRSAFEHHVLEVMRQAGSGSRVVFRTGAHS